VRRSDLFSHQLDPCAALGGSLRSWSLSILGSGSDLDRRDPFEGAVVLPDRPDDASQLVGERDGGAVVPVDYHTADIHWERLVGPLNVGVSCRQRVHRSADGWRLAEGCVSGSIIN